MSDMEARGQKFFIRYQLERVDYALTEDELTRLERGPQNTLKEFFIATLSVAIPCGVNIVNFVKVPFEWSYPLFINSMVSGICFLATLVLGVLWRKTKDDFKKLINSIKSRPKIEVEVVSKTAASGSSIIGGQSNQLTNA